MNLMSVWSTVVAYEFARLDNGHRSYGDVQLYVALEVAIVLVLMISVILLFWFRYFDWKAKNRKLARRRAFAAKRAFVRESERLQKRLLLELEMKYGERPESVGPES